MPRRRVATKKRKWSMRSGDELSTAFLLPDLHPWLKEFFTTKNLVPIQDEAWRVFPKWEEVGELGMQNAECKMTNDECRMENGECKSVILSRVSQSEAEPRAGAWREESHALHRESGILPPFGRQDDTGAESSEVLATHTMAAVDATTAPIDNYQFSPPLAEILNSQFPQGARPSAAPVPFVIPIEAVADASASRHLVRLARRMPERALTPAPDFLDHLQNHIEPIRAKVAIVRPSLRSRWQRAIERARESAPTFAIPAPYDELLIVELTARPIAFLWRKVFGRAWAFFGIPEPRVIIGLLKNRFCVISTEPKASGEISIVSRSLDFAEFIPDMGLRSRRRIGQWLVLPQFSFAVFRQAAVFAVTLAIIILPLKLVNWRPNFDAQRGRVLGATASIADTFAVGGGAFAKSSFQEAADAFDRARSALITLPEAAGTGGSIGLRVVKRLPVVGEKFARADDLRRAAIALAEASGAVARGLAMVADLDLASSDAPARLDNAIAAFTSAKQFAERGRPVLVRALPALTPDVDRAMSILERVERLLPILRTLAGVDRPQRILLAFQNTNELRPTGGFLGSLAFVDVRRGRVTSLELPGGGTYDISGIARTSILPPDPLRLLQPTWQMQDANWFPDFPTTARKLRWFNEQSGGPTVDAVIAVNASVLEDILALTGPVTTGNQTFTAANAIALLTDTIESESARATGKPKQVLADIAPIILERLTGLAAGGKHERLVLLDRLIRALDERDVQLAFTDDATQQAVVAAGWSGEIRPATRDALLVVHANLGGGKSDARIREDIAHEASVLADGSVIDTVTITRTHLGSPAPTTAPASEWLAGLANVDYLRVYVPRGAILMSAEGFIPPPEDAFERVPVDALPDRDLLAAELNEVMDPTTGVRVTEEFGRSVFGGWMQIPAGSQRSVRFTYRLPWKYEYSKSSWLSKKIYPQPYAFLAQKQSGTRAAIRHTIRLDPKWQATWRTANYASAGPQAWMLEDILTSDRLTGMMIAPK